MILRYALLCDFDVISPDGLSCLCVSFVVVFVNYLYIYIKQGSVKLNRTDVRWRRAGPNGEVSVLLTAALCESNGLVMPQTLVVRYCERRNLALVRAALSEGTSPSRSFKLEQVYEDGVKRIATETSRWIPVWVVLDFVQNGKASMSDEHAFVKCLSGLLVGSSHAKGKVAKVSKVPATTVVAPVAKVSKVSAATVVAPIPPLGPGQRVSCYFAKWGRCYGVVTRLNGSKVTVDLGYGDGEEEWDVSSVKIEISSSSSSGQVPGGRGVESESLAGGSKRGSIYDAKSELESESGSDSGSDSVLEEPAVFCKKGKRIDWLEEASKMDDDNLRTMIAESINVSETYDVRGDVVAMRVFRGSLTSAFRVLLFLLSWRMYCPCATEVITTAVTMNAALIGARAACLSPLGREQRKQYCPKSFHGKTR